MFDRVIFHCALLGEKGIKYIMKKKNYGIENISEKEIAYRKSLQRKIKTKYCTSKGVGD